MRNGEVQMYVGLDVHKRYCYYAMVDVRGRFDVKEARKKGFYYNSL